MIRQAPEPLKVVYSLKDIIFRQKKNPAILNFKINVPLILDDTARENVFFRYNLIILLSTNSLCMKTKHEIYCINS